MTEKFDIQDSQYDKPYHHLVGFRPFSNAWVMPWGQEYHTYVKKVLELSKKCEPTSIIDVGCGDGKVNFELARILPDIRNVGVDTSERSILLAKALNWDNGAEFLCKPIGLVLETFDLATLIEVLEHIPDEKVGDFVADIRERINNGGYLVVSVPSDSIPVTSKHYRHYNTKLLSEHLAGFELEEIHYLISPGILFKLLNRIIRKVATINFLRNFFFALYLLLCSDGTEQSCMHIVALYKKRDDGRGPNITAKYETYVRNVISSFF